MVPLYDEERVKSDGEVVVHISAFVPLFRVRFTPACIALVYMCIVHPTALHFTAISLHFV